MATDRSTLKGWFAKGLKPLASQFSAWIDSFWHKDDSIPISSIESLQATLNLKADTTVMTNAIASAMENANVQDGTLTQKGSVQLSNTLADDDTLAATPGLIYEVNSALAALITALTSSVYTKTQTDDAITNAVSGLAWKDGVATYAAILTTYPNPETGWLVPCEEDGIIYRYNGTSWVNSFLSVLSSALMKYNQDTSNNPTFNGSQLALLSEVPASPSDASSTVKGLVQLALDILAESDTKAITQGAVKRAIDIINTALATLQTNIDNIELQSGSSAPNVIFQYSEDGTSWHSDYASTDIYFRTSNDGGTTYSSAVRFKGTTGNSAYEDWKSLSGNESKTFSDFLEYLQKGVFTVSLNFEEVTTYTLICPEAMSIDSIESNVTATITITKSGAAYTYGTALAKFDTLMITPDVVCFINLKCTSL
jgi:hypothetical protein